MLSIALFYKLSLTCAVWFEPRGAAICDQEILLPLLLLYSTEVQVLREA